MRKVSRILLLVGGILAIVTAASLLVTAIILFASGSPLLTQFLEPIFKEQGIEDPEKITLAIQIASITMGVFFLIMALCGVPATIVNFAARKNQNKGLLIACIILNYLSGSYFGIAGGITGLIANAREERRNGNNVTDAQ
ncbi:MAG: hypothetical protein IJR08_05275 [Bacilli bacterium]|nr:hypothetical protein [Bacilli bacterium]